MKEVLERFLNALQCMDACFVADEALDRLPAPSTVRQTREGGVASNRLPSRGKTASSEAAVRPEPHRLMLTTLLFSMPSATCFGTLEIAS